MPQPMMSPPSDRETRAAAKSQKGGSALAGEAAAVEAATGDSVADATIDMGDDAVPATVNTVRVSQKLV